MSGDEVHDVVCTTREVKEGHVADEGRPEFVGEPGPKRPESAAQAVDAVGTGMDEPGLVGGEGAGDGQEADGRETVVSRPVGPRVRPPRLLGVSLRERLGREAVGVVVLIVLALVCAGLITAVVFKTRNDAAIAAREAAAYTPPALSTSSPVGDARIIAVVGDQTVLRGAPGTIASQRWPALLGSSLSGTVKVSGSVGAGYVSEGSNGDTFVDAASEVPTNAAVVVFVGGAADVGSTGLSVAKAATRAFAAAADRAPTAGIVAIGPLFVPGSADVDEVATLRTTLQSSARIADIRWVDPVGSRWLSDVTGTGDLTPAVERTIAAKARSAVEAELG